MYSKAIQKLKLNISPVENLQILLQGIGDPDPKIRCDLIAEELNNYIWSAKNNSDINHFLFYELINIKHIGLRGGEIKQVLIRSFSALALASVILTDANKFKVFIATDFYKALDVIENFLLNEVNIEKNSDEFGLVHCFAHGGDALTTMMTHKKSNKTLGRRVTGLIRTLKEREDIKSHLDENSKIRIEEAIKIGEVMGKM